MTTSACPWHSHSQQYFLLCLGLPYELFPLILPYLPLSLVPICSHLLSLQDSLLVASPTHLFCPFSHADAEHAYGHFPRLPCSSPVEPHLKILANEM